MKNKKLIYVAPQFYPNPTGFGVAFTNIIKMIVEKNYFTRIIIVTTEKKAQIPDELKDVCELYIVNLNLVSLLHYMPILLAKWYSSLLLSKFLKKLDKLNINANDIFFYEEFVMGHFKYAFEKQYPNNKHIIRVHGTFPEFTSHYKKLTKRKILFRLATNSRKINIASTTNFYFNYLNKYYFNESYDVLQNVNYFILPNALLNVNAVEKDINTKLNLFQLGRMDDVGVFQKGFLDTVKALQFIESILEQKAQDIQLYLVGDGEAAYLVENEIAKLNFIKVNYSKKKSNEEVLKILDNTDLVLMPSRCEGMSMFATEAMYKGKSIIFTNNNGLRDYLIDNINGLRIEEYDYTELARAILKYYYDKELLKIHSKNNLKCANDITNKTYASLDVLFRG